MSEQRYLLAIDNGTQSVRALLFDLAGNLVGKGKVELEPYYSEHPGWAEQDPEYYWASLGEAFGLAVEQFGASNQQLTEALARIEAALAAHGQELAFEPIDHSALFGHAPRAGSALTSRELSGFRSRVVVINR